MTSNARQVRFECTNKDCAEVRNGVIEMREVLRPSLLVFDTTKQALIDVFLGSLSENKQDKIRKIINSD